MFAALLLLLVYIVYWLPSITDFTKLLQVSNFLVTLSIFLLLAFSLNIHTGMTGLVNFGVIFFVAVGAIIVGVLTAPSDKFGYDWDIIPAVIVAVIFGALFGWLLACLGGWLLGWLAVWLACCCMLACLLFSVFWLSACSL